MHSSIRTETMGATFAASRALARVLPMPFIAGLLVLGSAARPASAQSTAWLQCGAHYAGFSGPCPAPVHPTAAPTHALAAGGEWASLTRPAVDVAHPERILHEACTTNGAELSACPPGPEALVTPEPLTLVLVGSGLAGIAAARRRRKAGLPQNTPAW